MLNGTECTPGMMKHSSGYVLQVRGIFVVLVLIFVQFESVLDTSSVPFCCYQAL